jgi:hypothetical protein
MCTFSTSKYFVSMLIAYTTQHTSHVDWNIGVDLFSRFRQEIMLKIVKSLNIFLIDLEMKF